MSSSASAPMMVDEHSDTYYAYHVRLTGVVHDGSASVPWRDWITREFLFDDGGILHQPIHVTCVFLGSSEDDGRHPVEIPNPTELKRRHDSQVEASILQWYGSAESPPARPENVRDRFVQRKATVTGAIHKQRTRDDFTQ